LQLSNLETLKSPTEERMRMKSRFVRAGLVGLIALVLNSCTATHGTGTGATGTGTGFMWVVSQGDQAIRSFNIDLSTGAATQVGSNIGTGLGPIAIALTPDASALFVANRDDNTITSYSVNSDGSLPSPCPAPKAPNCNVFAASPVAGTPVALAVDPSGKFLFVANQANQTLSPPPNTADTVAVFSISGTTLTSVGSFASTGNGPAALLVSPAGNFLYVANQFTSTVSILSYDSAGNLTEDATSPVPVGTNPSGLAFSRCAGTTTTTVDCPTANPPGYLFVANSGSNNISIFSACIQITTPCPAANGTLTQVGAPVGSSGTRPVSFIIDPALDFVYLVDNGSFQVSQYHYNSATGALSLLSPASVSTAASPLSGGITSDGQWVFVPNNGGSSVSSFSLQVAAGTTATGNMVAGTAITLVGQPSAVLIR
jgi:DNA-binding beta-propeller fold protein YncE